MTNQASKCFGCTNTDLDKPLISIKYKERSLWVCAVCLPLMLHGKKNIDDYM